MASKKTTKKTPLRKPGWKRDFSYPKRVYLVSDGISYTTTWYNTRKAAKAAADMYNTEEIAEGFEGKHRVITFVRP